MALEEMELSSNLKKNWNIFMLNNVLNTRSLARLLSILYINTKY